ncbi:hypothetical protein RND71_033550 [Anisodus tanguticus]|uniref:Uncharacterized protein n=1 Tax=Anisodus tanguticus TaxID=243964 RepID=A0AAE1R9J4_9SOLA|nr:hypothetical protein RND71_033550 [Anisodus tanguticus]
MLTCISLLIFTFIPHSPLADDDIESSLRTARGGASFIAQYLGIEEIMFCEFRMEDAGRDLELATEKYHQSQFEDVIKQIDEALNHIKICQESDDATYMDSNKLQDIANLVLLIKKIKKQLALLGPTLTPQIAH